MSEIKVNKISPRTACGTTTLGDTGDTFTIPAGVTITNSGTAAGFGATGAVSWDTTAKTTGFTAVDGVGYFVNTTAGAITVTLPLSPAAGAVIGVSDYAGTSDTNAITIGRNGSNINGAAADLNIQIENSAVTLVYVDGTQGWKATDTSNLNDIELQPAHVTATGGVETTDGDYKIHTFTGPGALCVSVAGNALGSNSVEYLVVAGGGGGSASYGGAAGAGGFRFASPSIAPLCYPAKPLAGPANLPVSATPYAITVGGGGVAGTSPTGAASGGSNSTFSTITSAGGGRGGNLTTPLGGGAGGDGGSGGGSSVASGTPRVAGTGNTPPVSPAQGMDGGVGFCGGNYRTGGGGGAMAVGVTSPNGSILAPGGVGGGLPTAFGSNGESSGSFRYYAGGGGGGAYDDATVSPGGLGGGGGSGGTTGTAGTCNTGGGGGGGSGAQLANNNGGAGGSGIIIIRYKYQ